MDAATDFLCLWGLDASTVAYDLPYRVVLGLIDRLMFEPNSMYRAKQLGSTDWYGFGRTEELLLHVSDGVRDIAKCLGMKYKPDGAEYFPRPGSSEPKNVVHKPKSIRDVDFSVLMPKT